MHARQWRCQVSKRMKRSQVCTSELTSQIAQIHHNNFDLNMKVGHVVCTLATASRCVCPDSNGWPLFLRFWSCWRFILHCCIQLVKTSSCCVMRMIQPRDSLRGGTAVHLMIWWCIQMRVMCGCSWCALQPRTVPFVSNGCDDGFLQLLISTCNCWTCASWQKEGFIWAWKIAWPPKKMSVPSVVVPSEKVCLE